MIISFSFIRDHIISKTFFVVSYYLNIFKLPISVPSFIFVAFKQ
jgi:hypothetical protein